MGLVPGWGGGGCSMMPGSAEWLVILGVALLIFGPSKLPRLGRAVGESIRNFKQGLGGLREPSEGEAAKAPWNRIIRIWPFGIRSVLSEPGRFRQAEVRIPASGSQVGGCYLGLSLARLSSSWKRRLASCR